MSPIYIIASLPVLGIVSMIAAAIYNKRSRRGNPSPSPKDWARK